MVAGKILSFQIDVRGESEGARKIAELDQSLAKLNEERRKSLKLSKESDAAAKKQVKNISALNAKITEGKRERTKLIAEEKRLTKAFQAGDGSVTKLRIKMQTLRSTMEKLNLTTKTGQREFKRLNAQYQRGTTTLRKYDQRLSGSTRLQGAFTKGITNSFKSLAVGLVGITALIRVFRSVIKVVGDFDTSLAKLASVTGKTKEEIEDLTKQAKQLGAVTQFTANQVQTLQIELAKLGFTSNEISLATPGILSFATATGANLAAAAKTAGAAVRVFGLSASETEDAVSTMAVATTKSGLIFEDWDTILSNAGPVALKFGFTLADVSALMGKLKDAGFDASKASTALRNIFLNLADTNGVLAQKLGGSVKSFDELVAGLIELDERGISLNSTLQATDKRSVNAFISLLKGSNSVTVLRDALVDVNEELQIMVDKQLDTLAGDMDLLTSAWQGFIFATGADVGPLRGVIQFLTDLTLKLSNLTLVTTKFNKQSGEEIARTFDLLTALTDKQGEHFSQMIEFFEDLGDEELLSRGIDQMAKDFAQIRKVNVKEGRALAGEFLRRREEIIEQEILAEKEKHARILKQEKDAIKDSLSAQREAQEEKAKIIEKARKKEEAKEISDLLRELAEEDLQGAAEDANKGLAEELQEAVDLRRGAWDEIIKQSEGGFAALEALVQNDLEIHLEAIDAKTQAENEAIAQRIANDILLKDIQIASVNEVFNIGSALLGRRFQKIEENAKKELSNKNLTEEQKEKVEEKFAEERAKLRRKQALVDKAQALFNIGINTAVGVSKVLAQTGVISPLLIPLIITLGALQAAAVLAAPVPSFAKGGVIDTDGGGGKVKSGYEMPWSTPQGDNTLALLKPREVILNEAQQMALGGSDTFRRIGVPGFAAGGAIGAPQPPVSGIDLLSLASAFAAAVNDKNVVLNVNELNAAEGDLAVINSTNEL